MPPERIEDWYKTHNGYEFLITSINLFEKSILKKQLLKNRSEKQLDEIAKDIERFIMGHNEDPYDASENLDEYNFLFVRLGIAVELSLKGIAVSKGYNIFVLEKRGILNMIFRARSNSFGKYEKFLGKKIDDNTKTIDFKTLTNSLGKLLEKSSCDKYSEVLRYFQKRRNEFGHFSRISNTYNHKDEIKRFLMLKEYFNHVIRPLNDRMAAGVVKI